MNMIQKEARLLIYQYNFKKYPNEKCLVLNPPFSKTFVNHPILYTESIHSLSNIQLVVVGLYLFSKNVS